MAYRPAMNIPIFVEADWTATPAKVMIAPKNMVARRPIPSDRYGAKGYAAREPMFYTCLGMSLAE